MPRRRLNNLDSKHARRVLLIYGFFHGTRSTSPPNMTSSRIALCTVEAIHTLDGEGSTRSTPTVHRSSQNVSRTVRINAAPPLIRHLTRRGVQFPQNVVHQSRRHLFRFVPGELVNFPSVIHHVATNPSFCRCMYQNPPGAHDINDNP